MHRRWLGLVLLLCAVFMCPRVSLADTGSAHSVSVVVLTLDSDDAEDQADALTSALRSRIRASQGWSLVETTQTLGMLTAAFRCPGKPMPADCEQRIADHLKTERFIYGYVTKGPAGQVTAEVHLFQKARPDTVVKESYSENLKDANDEALRGTAERILERLGGSAVGVIVVKMGNENGDVVVDGEKHAPMQGGVARVELSPGPHAVEVTTRPGVATQKRTVTVVAGTETVVDLALAGTVTSEPPEEKKPFPTRKVVGGGMMVLGVASGVVGIVMAAKYASDQSNGKTLRNDAGSANQGETLPAGKTPDDVCGKAGGLSNSAPICKANSDAHTHSTVAWVTGAVGLGLLAGGAVVFFTGKKQEQSASFGPLKNVRAEPVVGQTSGLQLSGAF